MLKMTGERLQPTYIPYYLYRQSKTVGNHENTGYAKAGYECLYNIFMMDETHTVLACGASGVAGGSLLLIPMACSLLGVGQDVAMQVVAVGFIIGVVQDSLETAINSSGDVIFCATAEYKERLNRGEKIEI